MTTKYQRVLWVYQGERLVYRLVLESKNWPDSYNLRHTGLIRVLPGRGHEVIPVSYQYIPSMELGYSHFYIKNIHVTYQTIISLGAWYQDEVGMKVFKNKYSISITDWYETVKKRPTMRLIWIYLKNIWHKY